MNEDEAQCEVLRILRKRCCTKLSLSKLCSAMQYDRLILIR